MACAITDKSDNLTCEIIYDNVHLYRSNMYTLYLLTTPNISIQTIDCNNLKNKDVLRILCFCVEGDWLGAGGGGGVRNI